MKKTLSTLGIFLVVAENYELLKITGMAMIAIVIISNLYEVNLVIRRAPVLRAMILTAPYSLSVIASLSCISGTASLLAAMAVKLVLIILFMVTSSRELLLAALRGAIFLHILFFVVHLFFLTVGQGGIYQSIVFLDVQTDFSESSVISFRATGLFDEPSLFGMTIIGLVLARYYLSGALKVPLVTFATFSVPTMFVAGVLKITAVIQNNKKTFAFVLLVASFLGALLYSFAVDREQNVKMSPLALRLNHMVMLLESPNLYKGSGFCSAYGILDLDMSKDDLRENYMGNFKDAGQVIFIVDRVGLIAFFLFAVIIFLAFPVKYCLMLLLYLTFSKVLFFSMAGMIPVIALCNFRR